MTPIAKDDDQPRPSTYSVSRGSFFTHRSQAAQARKIFLSDSSNTLTPC
jgi:hypothetical protein